MGAGWRPDTAQHSRRDALRLGGLVAAVIPLAACVQGYESTPDPLAELAAAARADSDAALAMAADHGTRPGHVQQVATEVATVRSDHADALSREVARANRPPRRTREQRLELADLAALGERLGDARDTARSLVPSASPHRAGLLASIAAGCVSALVLADALGEYTAPEATLPPGLGEPNAETLDALQEALAAEHAAVWTYGLVTAFLPDTFSKGIVAAAAEHRERRDTARQIIGSAGAEPMPPEPAYRTPEPVSDQASAMAVVIAAESDATHTWLTVLQHSDDSILRTFALDILESSAARATRWRHQSGASPAAVALPGQR